MNLQKKEKENRLQFCCQPKKGFAALTKCNKVNKVNKVLAIVWRVWISNSKVKAAGSKDPNQSAVKLHQELMIRIYPVILLSMLKVSCLNLLISSYMCYV